MLFILVVDQTTNEVLPVLVMNIFVNFISCFRFLPKHLGGRASSVSNPLYVELQPDGVLSPDQLDFDDAQITNGMSNGILSTDSSEIDENDKVSLELCINGSRTTTPRTGHPRIVTPWTTTPWDINPPDKYSPENIFNEI